MGKVMDGGGSNILMGKIVEFRGKIHNYNQLKFLFSLLSIIEYILENIFDIYLQIHSNLILFCLFCSSPQDQF